MAINKNLAQLLAQDMKDLADQHNTRRPLTGMWAEIMDFTNQVVQSAPQIEGEN